MRIFRTERGPDDAEEAIALLGLYEGLREVFLVESLGSSPGHRVDGGEDKAQDEQQHLCGYVSGD